MASRLAEDDGAALLLRHCVCTFLTVGEALRCQAACTLWRRRSRGGKWAKRCVLAGGVTPAERRRLWPHLSRAREVADRHGAQLGAEEGLSAPLDGEASFERYAVRELPRGRAAEIERDVHRTLPTHPRFKGEGGAAGRSELLKVLCALAAAEPGIGYCQGMNFVVAVLLINLDRAEDAFWMALALYDGYDFRHIFAPGVPLLPLRVFQFSGVARERLPRLWRHLQGESFSLDIFAQQCVMTLFSYCVELDFLAHVWDIFLMLGWKAFFSIGLGLLASLEGELLGMSVEQISRSLHQTKRSFGSMEGGPSVQGALGSLMRFKVPRSTLRALQRTFGVERWEVLLFKACKEGAGRESLPPGVERSSCGTCLMVNTSALRAEDTPPWRAFGADIRADAGISSSSPANGGASGPLAVPLEELQALRADLEVFDAQTQNDVETLRSRVADVEKELSVLLQETAKLRGEVEQSALERDEWQEYKEVLMATMQVAVRTSAAASPTPARAASQLRAAAGDSASDGNHACDGDGGRAVPVGQDTLVVQCLGKLTRLESDIFEMTARWQARVKELEPFADQIQELSDVKSRSMAQLSDFLEQRAAERRSHLEAGLEKLFL